MEKFLYFINSPKITFQCYSILTRYISGEYIGKYTSGCNVPPSGAYYCPLVSVWVAILKARSHIETQLNSTVELSWVSVSFDM